MKKTILLLLRHLCGLIYSSNKHVVSTRFLIDPTTRRGPEALLLGTMVVGVHVNGRGGPMCSRAFLTLVGLISLACFYTIAKFSQKLGYGFRAKERLLAKPYSWETVAQNLTRGLPSRFQANLQLYLDRGECTVPQLIHQTWKSEKIPKRYAKYVASWLRVNRDWKYSFTTNEMNRELIAKRFPEFLKIYDGYRSDIQRADFVRYFLLYEFGGVYADIDFEALKPLQGALAGHSCIVGQEPYEHAHVLYDLRRLICNAVMVSCRHHPFWLAVFQELIVRKEIITVRATGPKMLSAALEQYESLQAAVENNQHSSKGMPVLPKVHIPRPSQFYPFFDETNVNHRLICAKSLQTASARRRKACKHLRANHFRNNKTALQEAVAVHHWAHTWHRVKEISPLVEAIDTIVENEDAKRVFIQG